MCVSISHNIGTSGRIQCKCFVGVYRENCLPYAAVVYIRIFVYRLHMLGN